MTDDCQLIERTGAPVYLVRGAYANLKITTPEDVFAAEGILRATEDFMGKRSLRYLERSFRAMRIGHGYDVHRLVTGRALLLGGVHIPYETGLLGHSDADVLLHAVSDALLGQPP